MKENTQTIFADITEVIHSNIPYHGTSEPFLLDVLHLKHFMHTYVIPPEVGGGAALKGYRAVI